MLPEHPNSLVRLWWRWYTRYALRKHFHRVMLYGEHTPTPPAPTLFLANHVSFWDGILLSHLLRVHFHDPDPRCMIDAVQVAKHPFFRRVGGFSVDRSSPRDALRAIAHAADLLNQAKSVVLFPQGRIVPADAPLELERGFTYILDRAPAARVVVISLRYEFWTDQRPELLVHLSPPHPASSFGLDSARTVLGEGLASLRQASLSRSEGLVLLRGRTSVADLLPGPGTKRSPRD